MDGDAVREGQFYQIENTLTTGLIYKITSKTVTLRRITEHDGRVCPKEPPKLVNLPRSGVESSIRTGHIIIHDDLNNPNAVFSVRKSKCT